jgi:flagellar protein FliO/FliZ
VSGFLLVVRVVASLGAVLALLAFLARGNAKKLLTGRRAASPLEVLARQGLARSASVVVVRAADRALVLGVTDASVTLLAEVDPEDMNMERVAGTPFAEGQPPRTPAWRDALDTMRERTVRRS